MKTKAKSNQRRTSARPSRRVEPAKTRRSYRDLLRVPSRPTLAVVLATLTAAVIFFLRHDFVAMWIEGFAEYIPQELAIMGFWRLYSGALHVGSSYLPLAFGAYTGCAGIYFDLPAAYAWIHGWTSDPFLFRFGGLVLLSVLTWTLYALMRRLADVHAAMWAALIFISLPNVLLFSLTDRQVFMHGPAAALLAALFSVYWVERGARKWLALAAFAWGLTLNTRAEALAWPGLATFLFIVLFRPPAVRKRVAAAVRRPSEIALALFFFLAGAAPFIGYTFTNEDGNIFRYFWRLILPHSQHTAGSMGGVRNLLLTRLEHFRFFNLLNRWDMYDLSAGNYLFAIAFSISAAFLLFRWIFRREHNLALFVIAVALPLSMLVTGGVRQEHLAILQPAVVVVVALGIARVPPRLLSAAARNSVFAVIFASSLGTTALDYYRWTTQPPGRQTMLNQSDPVLLTKGLEPYASDRILYTNIGMLQYVAYTSRGRMIGEDVTTWDGDAAFGTVVRKILGSGDRRRVFVAISSERDGYGGHLPRTKLLYKVLADSGIQFTVNRLSSARNPYLYDLIVVEPGVAIRGRLD